MSPFDVSESDKITLVTADEPPQRYVVSRSRLTVLSGVFRDLLSTPTTAEDEEKGEIPLTENAEELEGFLMVLQDEEEKLTELEEDEDLEESRAWYSLARMADKYDCKAASREVLAHAWEWLADGHDYGAFILAAVLDSERLIRRLGWTAVDYGWHQDQLCPDRWPDRLEKARKHRHSQVRDKLLKLAIYGTCAQACENSKRQIAINDAVCCVMRYYRCSESVEKQLRQRLDQVRGWDVLPTICGECIDRLCTRAREIDEDLPSELELVDSA